jgi:putative ABC transport system permease protein
MSNVACDIKYAFRSLASSPGFTIAAVLTVAVAVGPTTAMFSVVNGVLLRPLPYKDADRLVRIIERIGENAPTGVRLRAGGGGMELTEIGVVRVRTRSLSNIAPYELTTATLVTRGDVVSVEATRAGAALFEMLAVPPLLGRTVSADDEKGGGQAVVVLSHALWQGRFGARTEVIGNIVSIDGRDHTVIGVMPRGFEFPPETPAQLWTPFAAPITARSFRPVIARLADGRTLEEAAVEVTRIINQHRLSLDTQGSMAGRIPLGAPSPPPPPPLDPRGAKPAPPRERVAAPPPLPQAEFAVATVQDQLVGPVRHGVQILTVGVALLLLLGCANVANLMLARTTWRERELAVRAALGASVTRLATLLLAESTMVALAGATLAVMIAVAGTHLLQGFGVAVPRLELGIPGGLPRFGAVQIDTDALIFTGTAAMFVALMIGALPVWRHARGRVQLLQGHHVAAGAGFNLFGPQRLQGLLVTAQVAMATMLLVGAGLLLRTLVNLASTDPGYDTARVLTFQLRDTQQQAGSSPFVALPEAVQLLAKYDDLAIAIGRIPGVTAVGYSQALPMTRTLTVVGLRMSPNPPRDPRPGPPDFAAKLPPETPNARAVSYGFLEAMGTPIIAGRGLQETDSAAGSRAMVVNRSLAESGVLWDNPIGRQLYAVGREPWEIVGIAEDVRRFGLDQEPDPQIFVDFRQAPDLLVVGPPMLFAVRAIGNPAALSPLILTSLRQIDPNLGMERVATTAQLMGDSLARSRLYALVLSAFAAIALTLAALGIYAVLAHAVARRTREIGIRTALGASRRGLVGLVLGQAMLLMTFGLVVGLGGATAIARALQAMLFGLTPTDPTTYVAVAVLISTVVVLGALFPLRSAAGVDPVRALRE